MTTETLGQRLLLFVQCFCPTQMKMCAFILLCALLTFTQQVSSSDKCVCELSNTAETFPHDKLSTLNDDASKCNGDITPQKRQEQEILQGGLERRLSQLQKDVSELEREDDGNLYGAVSLRLIENELNDILRLFDKLNSTTRRNQRLAADTTAQLQRMRAEMEELEKFDISQVVKTQQDSQRLKRALNQCQNGVQPTVQPTQPPHVSCPHGQLMNVSGPRVFTAGEYGGSYKYGGWGRDPKPTAGRSSWYWMVVMTTSNVFSNYVRLYSSLSALIVGLSTPGTVQIHPANPTTNTIQGPNVAMYGGALYYNCYNQDHVCRFNLTTKTISTLQLPKGTRYNSGGNFCHMDTCYPYSDLDIATDESGLWVIYTTTQHFGNLVLSKVTDGDQVTLGQTWHTSVYKRAVSNTFVACGVLYATRHVDKDVEEIFYSFDTSTGTENFNVGIFIKKMQPNINFLNYSPVDQMLHAYCDAYMVSYKLLFDKSVDINQIDSY